MKVSDLVHKKSRRTSLERGKKRIKKASLSKELKEYCSETSLHGPKYITDYGNTVVQKSMWCIVFTGAVIFGISLVFNIIANWLANPIITSIDDTNYALNEIEFPAITICPVAKVIPGKLVNEICEQKFYQKGYNKTNSIGSIMKTVLAGLLGIPPGVAAIGGGDDSFPADVLSKNLNFSTKTLISSMKKVTPTCRDYLKNCTWNNKPFNCAELFRIVSTDDGFCCTFNSIPPKFTLAGIGDGIETNLVHHHPPPPPHFDPDRFLNSSLHNNNNNSNNNINNHSNNNNNNGNHNENKLTCLSSKVLEQNNQRLEEICHQLAVEKNASISSSTTNSSSTTYNSNSSTSSSGSTFDYTIRMAKGAGIHLGLSFIVKDIKCGWLNAAGFEGSRYYIHNPSAFPEVRSKGKAIGPNTENFLAITATLIETEEATKNWSNKTRKCNFKNEKLLEFYKIYSRSNCEIEHKIRMYKKLCNCKPFYYPGDVQTCKADGMQCIHNATTLDEIYSEKVNLSECLPACKEIHYLSSASTVPKKASSENGDSKVWMFFKDSWVVKYKRAELYRITDVISNIGGSLGLCVGFSLISAMEILYFFTCRYFCKKSI